MQKSSQEVSKTNEKRFLKICEIIYFEVNPIDRYMSPK